MGPAAGRAVRLRGIYYQPYSPFDDLEIHEAGGAYHHLYKSQMALENYGKEGTL